MEVLHRANGKWIDGVETTKQKIRLYEFGLKVFDYKVENIDSLIELMSN
jgi:hypothetical protein